MKRTIVVIFILMSCIIATDTMAAIIFRDNFEYTVGREDPNAASLFVSSGGWSLAKTYQSNAPGAVGWLYTTNSIPGFVGSFPGTSSSRVLVIEARPATLRPVPPNPLENSQTDVYLQIGSEVGPDTTIPGNAWIQFWIYSNYYGSELSTYANRNKFGYPCPGPYPCTNGKWLWMTGSGGCNDPGVSGNNYDQFICLESPAANRSNASDDAWRWRLGQNLNTSTKIRANTWTLVKLHIDTSGSQGRYEAWIRTVSGSWVKVTEYIGGITPSFTWPVTPGGQRLFRMPTVINYNDSWQYMDDFVIAESEADLPIYGATPLKIPAPAQIRNITPSN